MHVFTRKIADVFDSLARSPFFSRARARSLSLALSLLLSFSLSLHPYLLHVVPRLRFNLRDWRVTNRRKMPFYLAFPDFWVDTAHEVLDAGPGRLLAVYRRSWEDSQLEAFARRQTDTEPLLLRTSVQREKACHVRAHTHTDTSNTHNLSPRSLPIPVTHTRTYSLSLSRSLARAVFHLPFSLANRYCVGGERKRSVDISSITRTVQKHPHLKRCRNTHTFRPQGLTHCRCPRPHAQYLAKPQPHAYISRRLAQEAAQRRRAKHPRQPLPPVRQALPETCVAVTVVQASGERAPAENGRKLLVCRIVAGAAAPEGYEIVCCEVVFAHREKGED